MINPLVERRYADCSELVEAWRSYLDVFSRAMSGQAEINPELEQAFMETKARIAMLHDSFLESLKHDQGVAQNMLAIVNRSITLKYLKKSGGADLKKIEIEWHECYLLLNETVSTLQEERERLAGINETAYKLGKVREKIFLQLKWFFKSIYFKIFVAFAIVLGVIFGVPSSTWNKLRKMDKVGKPYGAYLDFKRDVMKMGGPYSSLEKFMGGKLDQAKLPSGWTRNDVGPNQMAAASFFRSRFQVMGEDAADKLQASEGFQAVTLNSADNTERVIVLVFYWFDPGAARQWEIAYRSFEMEDRASGDRPFTEDFTVVADNNVLVVMQSRSLTGHNTLKSALF